MHPLIQFLEQARNEEEDFQKNEILKTVDELRLQLHHSTNKISSEKLQTLQVARCLASGTLRRGKLRSEWDQAQILIHKWILENKCLFNEDDIFTLYSELIGEKVCSYRTRHVYTTKNRHPDPEHIPILMDYFFSVVGKNTTEHSVEHASKLRQIIVSIHPFGDGNGRLSQVLSDFVLLREGFLPQSFAFPGAAMMMGLPDQKVYMTPHTAFVNFAESVIHSYNVMLN